MAGPKGPCHSLNNATLLTAKQMMKAQATKAMIVSRRQRSWQTGWSEKSPCGMVYSLPGISDGCTREVVDPYHCH